MLEDVEFAISQIATHDPDRLPVLVAICEASALGEVTGRYMGEFDVATVRNLARGQKKGNLSYFVRRGLAVPNNESRHRYYQVPQAREIMQAIADIGRMDLIPQ